MLNEIYYVNKAALNYFPIEQFLCYVYELNIDIPFLRCILLRLVSLNDIFVRDLWRTTILLGDILNLKSTRFKGKILPKLILGIDE